MKKTKNSELFHRFCRVLLPLAVLVAMILVSAKVEKKPFGPDTASVYARAVVTKIVEDHTGGQPFVGVQRMEALILNGQYKGYTAILDSSNSYNTGAFCQEGTKVIAYVRSDGEGGIVGAVYNYDRTGMVWLLIGLFAAVLLLVGGKKGAAALYALIFTFACVLCVYIPLLYLGMNAILAAVLSSLLILIASIYIINGWSVKTLCAIIGTAVGVLISGGLAMAIGQGASLSGYNTDYVEAMLAMPNGLDIGGVLYAGVLISSLGAVMDVSVSVVAAMQEIREKAPRLKSSELFASGMRVGHDMMGTMSNTLILAYAGSATTVLLYTYGMPVLKIMGDNAIVIEILCGICGTIGVVLTVPIQAAITALILQPKKKKS